MTRPTSAKRVARQGRRVEHAPWRAASTGPAPHAARSRGADPGSAAARLARSRQAIIEQLAPPPGGPARAGWFAGMRAAGGSWWRVHPARLVLDLALPPAARWARRRPWTFLALAAAGGAVVAIARPWRLLSATGLLLAVVKSSRLSSLLPLALAALRPGGLRATREPPLADSAWHNVNAS